MSFTPQPDDSYRTSAIGAVAALILCTGFSAFLWNMLDLARADLTQCRAALLQVTK